MSSSSSSFFHRFWIVNSLIAAIFGGLFVFMGGLEGSKYWGIFFGTITLFGILSLGLYYYNSWKYSISDASFSALKTGFKISLAWMFIWDIFIISRIIYSYLASGGQCSGIINWTTPPHCSFWEYPFEDFESFISLILIGLLIILPILFSITGFYFDRRKNKASFPWMLPTLFFGIIFFFIGFNIYL